MKDMKKRLIAALALWMAAGTGAFAQTGVQDVAAKAAEALSQTEEEQQAAAKPNYWTKFVKFDLGFTNTLLTNWAAGGYNQTTLATGLDANANYKKGLSYWNNRLQLDYGFLYSDDKPIIQKNKDRIQLDSKWGYKTSEKSKWSYTATFKFLSQFTDTHKFPHPGGDNPSYKDWMDKAILQSSFLSPGYTTLSLGIDWTPKPWFTVSFSPLTGGFTIVRREELRKTYGMQLKEAYESQTANIEGYMYRMARFQLGAQLEANAKFKINDVFAGETKLVLFSDYLHNPTELRVNWDNKITWQFAKHLALAFQTWLIYDPNVLIDGAQKVQFKEFLTLNFTYTLEPRKAR